MEKCHRPRHDMTMCSLEIFFLSQEEWSNGLREAAIMLALASKPVKAGRLCTGMQLGYFGASMELYSVLDTTNDGTINFEESTTKILRHFVALLLYLSVG